MKGNSEFSRFALYGEENGAIAPEFLHIEPISSRSSRYEWTIRPHTHPGIFQIIFLEQGTGRLVADGVEIDLRPAALATIPSGSVHAFDFAVDAEGWVLSIASTLVNELTANNRTTLRGIGAIRAAAVAPNLPEKVARRISWLLNEVAVDFAARGAGHLLDSMLATLTLLLSLSSENLNSLMQSRQMPAGTDARREHLVQRFRFLVDQHFREGWHIPRYAAEMGTSTPSLSRACLAVVGRSPGDIALDRIYLEAMRALTYTALGVGRIAEDLGFVDPAYFTRFFKVRSGMTPSKFRTARAWLKEHG